MKLTFKQIDAFLKKPDAAARAILVYGPDAGLVKERAAMLGKTVVSDLNDPFNVCDITGDILGDDPARLEDEARAVSMMGGDRLIRIKDSADKLTTLFKDYLKNPVSGCLIVLEGGDLGARSTLRQLFEKSDKAAALPCYVEGERDLLGFIRQRLQDSGYRIDSDAATWLAGALAGDRQRVRGEIEKLITYMGDEKSVTIIHARACCGNAAEQSLDDVVYGTANGQTEAALKAYHTLIEEGIPVITILRSLQNHFRRLHLAKMRLEAGEMSDHIMKTLSPPVFFKQTDAFGGQMRKWKADVLLKTLDRLSDVEAQCKQTAMPAETLCAQTILSLSRVAA